MIKTVVRSHSWPPQVIDSLYLDSIDFHGLIYWYDDVSEEIRKIETPK